MPVKRTKAKGSRRLDNFKIEQLLTGECLLAGTGYAPPGSAGCNHWSEDEWRQFREAMRADWAIHGPAVMAWWRGENDAFADIDRRATRERLAAPWAATEFGLQEG